MHSRASWVPGRGSPTSHGIANALPPRPVIRRATSSSLAPLRADRTTFAPASARASAKVTPNPYEAPVTIAVLPFSAKRFLNMGSYLRLIVPGNRAQSSVAGAPQRLAYTKADASVHTKNQGNRQDLSVASL